MAVDLEPRRGIIVAVCKSPKHGYPTYPQDMVIVGSEGIEGDAHSGPLRNSFTKPGTLKPNDRPISIVADEVRRAMNENLGLDMKPGDFNEQILVRGLGPLDDVEIGSTIAFGSGVVMEVTDNAFPCTKLEAHNNRPGLIQALVEKGEDGRKITRRGILAKVVQTGELRQGVEVTISRPPTQP